MLLRYVEEPKDENIFSPVWRWRVGLTFLVHKTFLELWGKNNNATFCQAPKIEVDLLLNFTATKGKHNLSLLVIFVSFYCVRSHFQTPQLLNVWWTTRLSIDLGVRRQKLFLWMNFSFKTLSNAQVCNFSVCTLYSNTCTVTIQNSVTSVVKVFKYQNWYSHRITNPKCWNLTTRESENDLSPELTLSPFRITYSTLCFGTLHSVLVHWQFPLKSIGSCQRCKRFLN